MVSQQQKILVIKLGALGDFILAQSAFAAIRAHHPNAAITLLTTAPFAALAQASPYFDDIWIDDKPQLNPLSWIKLWRRLNGGNFHRVYDLQTSDRSNLYYKLFVRKPEWSGIAAGCSHPDPTPDRAAVHALELRVNQLQAAGIDDVPFITLDWLTGGNAHILPPKAVLLVPGSAPHRPEKRWPLESYAALAQQLVAQGFTPVVLGSAGETALAQEIVAAAPTTIDLTNRTSLFDIADLARQAVAAVGNDTGPMHLLAAAGCPSVVLFSAASDPAHSRPRGAHVVVLAADDLATLTVNNVARALDDMGCGFAITG